MSIDHTAASPEHASDPAAGFVARRWTPPLPFRQLILRDAGRAPLEVGHTRLIVTTLMFSFAFTIIAARLVDVSLLGAEAPKRLTHAPQAYQAPRADIIDRNGTLLATTVATQSVYAEPKKLLDAADAARKLTTVLPDLKYETLLARLKSEKSFVYIKRNLTPRQQLDINRLGLPGIAFQREDRRIYPQGSAAAHVLGFSDIDNRGLAGIEKSFDETLRAGTEPVQLSIDIRIQHILRAEITSAMHKFQAIGAAGMVMDARSGEMLAMVSLPDFDPNNAGQAPDDARFNRDTLGIYEMGSTFKIFNTAMALDAGTTTLAGGYDATNPIKIGRFEISDYHAKKRFLTVPEIFMYSSNIGSAKMAMDVGVPAQRAFFDRLGMLHAPKFEIPEVGSPQIPQPWRPINLMTVAYGHGISVSALQTVSATAAIVNGGILVPATLIKRREGEAVAGRQVVSMKTSMTMRRLLRLVVEQGTGKEGEVKGYLVGGKTGTAEKPGGHQGYREKALISSFVAAFPIIDPQYIVMIMLDEPKGTKETFGFATAGWVAAPSASRVIARVGSLLGLPPIDDTAPEIRKSLAVDITGGGPRGTQPVQ